MENKINIADQNAQQTGQYSVNELNIIPQEKPKTKRLHYIIITIVVLLLGFMGTYLVTSNIQKQSQSSFNSDESPTVILDATPTIPTPSITPTSSKDSLVTAHNNLGLNLLKNINTYPSIENREKGGNVFISPISISLALSMAYHGARGSTQQEMGQVLHYSDLSPVLINEYSQKLLTILNQSKDITLEVANSIWINEHADDLKLKVNPQFVTDITNYYFADAKSLDFWQPNAARVINSWVNDKTHGKISDIVPTPIDKYTAMYIVNAIYFKGLWANDYQFDKLLTQSRQFYSDNKPAANVQMMKQENEFFYQENDQFQAVQLPYGKNNGNFKMYVFLPKENLLTQFIDSLTMENITNWKNEFPPRNGSLLLPRFKMELEFNLRDTFERLGMKQAFSDQANFMDGIVLTGSQPVKIGEILHKTFIDVNEEGSEAAAVTTIQVPVAGGAMEPVKPFYMEVNRPFVFMIEDGNSSEILFLGLVKNFPSVQPSVN